MNHQLFEDWLLSDQHLTNQQRNELYAHLKTCVSCSALTDVNIALESACIVSPVEGFVDRFQVRLVARQKTQHARNLWGLLILFIAVLGVLLWSTEPMLSEVVHSPIDVLASWLTELMSLWALIQTFGEAISVLLKVVAGFVPSYLWVLILVVTIWWSLAWVVSLMKFVKISARSVT